MHFTREPFRKPLSADTIVESRDRQCSFLGKANEDDKDTGEKNYTLRQCHQLFNMNNMDDDREYKHTYEGEGQEKRAILPFLFGVCGAGAAGKGKRLSGFGPGVVRGFGTQLGISVVAGAGAGLGALAGLLAERSIRAFNSSVPESKGSVGGLLAGGALGLVLGG